MQLRNRKRVDTNTVPAEIQEYYNAEQRERVGLAWIIAIISLIVSLAVIFGIFFGGRYIYRTYIHKNKTNSSTSVGKGSSSSQTKPEPKPDNNSANNNPVTQPSGQSDTTDQTSSTSNSSSAASGVAGRSLAHTGPDSTEE